PRSNAVFALPANQLIGATHAEINSQPRAQGYAATYGVPLAQNARGVGIPIDYHGQCYANYPGEPKVDCGIPFTDATPPSPPPGGPFGGDAFKAHAEASGSDGAPDATGTALTVMQNVTIGGAPVTIGPAGLVVQGQPIGQVPAPAVKPILDQMAAHGMTIEPLPTPRISRDEATGLIEAATDGFRI